MSLWGTLWNATGLNRLWPYALTVLLSIAIITAVYLQGQKIGKQSALSKHQTDWLKQYHKEVQNRAVIQNMRSATARDRLRERWGDD